MPHSESTAKLNIALAKAQSKFTKLGKDKTGREGNLSFKYVQLPDVLSMVRPLLNAEGVYLSQPLVRGEDGLLRQTTKVQLEDEWDQSDGVPIPALVPGKEMGKTITYARRIDLMPFLGISGEDEDEDAPDLKPNSSFAGMGKSFVGNSSATKPVSAFKPNAPERGPVSKSANDLGITDDDIPDFNQAGPGNTPTLASDAKETAEFLETFVPLSKDRNDLIQARLADLVKTKTLDRRKLTVFLEARHEGKRSFEVSAKTWEETISLIETAVSEGETAIKNLLKGAPKE